MEFIVVGLVALAVSIASLFSGFGLGTVLMPAFALFFPLPVAIAATAVVHLANNIFKVALVGRHADWKVVVRFALPAAIAAIAGAWLLVWLSWLPVPTSYHVEDRVFQVTIVKTAVGILIIGFALFELVPGLKRLSFDSRLLPVGGIISGLLGGFSGNQGALRSAFLIKSGLNPKAFIGTTTVSAVVVDLVRVPIYGASFYFKDGIHISADLLWLVLTAIIFAFLGSFIGSRLMGKIEIRMLQNIVGAMLILVGLGLITGLI